MPTEERLDHLEDDDHGQYQVTTEASVYLIDLDHRLLVRSPGAGMGPHIAPDGARILVADLPHDYEPLQLVQLVLCQVGELLLAFAEHPEGIKGRISTVVQEIRRLPGQPSIGNAGCRSADEGSADTAVRDGRAGDSPC